MPTARYNLDTVASSLAAHLFSKEGAALGRELSAAQPVFLADLALTMKRGVLDGWAQLLPRSVVTALGGKGLAGTPLHKLAQAGHVLPLPEARLANGLHAAIPLGLLAEYEQREFGTSQLARVAKDVLLAGASQPIQVGQQIADKLPALVEVLAGYAGTAAPLTTVSRLAEAPAATYSALLVLSTQTSGPAVWQQVLANGVALTDLMDAFAQPVWQRQSLYQVKPDEVLSFLVGQLSLDKIPAQRFPPPTQARLAQAIATGDLDGLRQSTAKASKPVGW